MLFFNVSSDAGVFFPLVGILNKSINFSVKLVGMGIREGGHQIFLIGLKGGATKKV